MKNLIVAISFGLITASAQSMVWQSDGTPQNIQFFHDNRAVDGDTITIPSGTFSWTGTVLLTKAITLQGNTTTDPVNGTANTQTLIQDNQSDRNSALIELRGGGQRLTGLAFAPGSTINGQNGMIRLEVGNIPIRIDHCDFNGLYWNNTIGVFDRNYGVIDHCVRRNSPVINMGFVHCWFGRGAQDNGDPDFEAPAGWGGPNFLFIEDNYMDGGTDITQGGKICARHNIITNNNSFGSHGTARTFPDGRGGRAYEVYNNEFRYNNNFSSIDGPDSGSSVYHDNVVTPHTFGIAMNCYRAFQSFGAPFFQATATNPWDFHPAGTLIRILDQPGLGAGNHINRNVPAWPNAVDEPCYSWSNTSTDDGSPFGFTAGGPGGITIVAGRDYINTTNTAMPGYIPYCYPHPLVSGVPCGGPSPTPTPTPTAGPTPVAPSDLTATMIDCRTIQLDWTDNSDNEDGFKLEESFDGGIVYYQFDNVGPDIVTYTSTNYAPNSPYFFRIRAFNGGGNSPYSNIANVFLPACSPTPTPTPTATATATPR